MSHSPARRLLTLVRYDSMLRTRQQMDESVLDTLDFAYRARLPFAPDDIATFLSCVSEDARGRVDVEQQYRHACTYGHVSAAIAWETHMNRKPWVRDGERIWVLRSFTVAGQGWLCKSISDDAIVGEYFCTLTNRYVEHTFTRKDLGVE